MQNRPTVHACRLCAGDHSDMDCPQLAGALLSPEHHPTIAALAGIVRDLEATRAHPDSPIGATLRRLKALRAPLELLVEQANERA